VTCYRVNFTSICILSFLCSVFLPRLALLGLSWRWRQQVPLNCWYLYTSLQGVISQNTEIFISTAVRTSYLPRIKCCVLKCCISHDLYTGLSSDAIQSATACQHLQLTLDWILQWKNEFKRKSCIFYVYILQCKHIWQYWHLKFEQGAELKEQFERLRSQLHENKNDTTQEKDIPMPHLEPQVTT